MNAQRRLVLALMAGALTGRELQSQNIEFTMKRLRELIEGGG